MFVYIKSVEKGNFTMEKRLRIRIFEFDDELRANSNLQVRNVTTPLALNKREKANVKDVTPQDIFYLHRDMNGLTVEWEGQDISDPDVRGSIKILSVKDILRDWSGVVYFDFTPNTDRIRNFRPIDFFVDEACAGAFLNEPDNEDDSLYLYNFEGEPVNLHLDMKAYVEMMLAAKGFLYWHYALIEILSQKENPASQRFKAWMPRLFPEFSWTEYVALYERLKH